MKEVGRVVVNDVELVFNIIPLSHGEAGIFLCTEYRDGRDRTISLTPYHGTLEDQIDSCVKYYRK